MRCNLISMFSMNADGMRNLKLCRGNSGPAFFGSTSQASVRSSLSWRVRDVSSE